MKKIAIITGASTGLGASLVRKCVRAGYMVYGVSRTKNHWKQVFADMGTCKRFSLDLLDVTKEKNVARYIKRVWMRHGRINLLINNAGIAHKPTSVETKSLESFKQIIHHNLVSTFLMCKHAIPRMKKQRSLIVNISSMAGKRAVPFMAAYSASKFGILALSQSVAKENKSSKLKCVTVCPGGMNTEMRANVFGCIDARKQQSADYVAGIVMNVVRNKIHVDSGGDIVIRHGKVSEINPAPSA